MTGSKQRPIPALCKSCSARIYWTVSDAGKANPVDAEPVENGNLRLYWRHEKLRSSVIKKDAPHVGDRFVSHFVTCPQRAQHRRHE